MNLTTDQEKALIEINNFILDKDSKYHVLAGFAGTGKSTVIKELVDTFSATEKAYKLLTGKECPYELRLTATTNQAANVLSKITKKQVRTIHSLLNLRIKTINFEKRLVGGYGNPLNNIFVVIDEASFLNNEVLDFIDKISKNKNMKFLFVGDPFQIPPVKYNKAPVFTKGYKTSILNEVVRQTKNSPITNLAVKFKDAVETGELAPFIPDNNVIRRLDRQEFVNEMVNKIRSADWHPNTCRILTWTNKTAIRYNEKLAAMYKGSTTIQVDDEVVVNSYLKTAHCHKKTDELVKVRKIQPMTLYDVPGFMYTFYDGDSAFMPSDPLITKVMLNKAKKEKDAKMFYDVEQWVDLRLLYSSTVHKSQGSTYEDVYIDLGDIRKVRDAKLIYRLLYVATSRATNSVTFIGDLVK